MRIIVSTKKCFAIALLHNLLRYYVHDVTVESSTEVQMQVQVLLLMIRYDNSLTWTVWSA